MGIDFETTTKNYWTWTSNEPFPTSVLNFSMTGWCKNDGTAGDRQICSFYGFDTARLGCETLEQAQFKWTGLGTVSVKAGGAGAITTGTGTWHHITAVIGGLTDRRCYVDGTKATDTTSVDTNGGFTQFTIGAHRNGDDDWDGQIAEIAVYDTALTDADVAQLAAGYSPMLVRPDQLIDYWPMISLRSDIKYANSRLRAFDPNTINEPGTISNDGTHPAIIYPSHGRNFFVPAAAAGGPTPGSLGLTGVGI